VAAARTIQYFAGRYWVPAAERLPPEKQLTLRACPHTKPHELWSGMRLSTCQPMCRAIMVQRSTLCLMQGTVQGTCTPTPAAAEVVPRQLRW
jgi:hypothetical protein